MASLSDYFAKERPNANWEFGDRVYGKYNGIPFVGTCGGEGMVNEEQGSLVTVFLDLPLKYKDTVHTTFIKVKGKTLKKLSTIEDDNGNSTRAAGSRSKAGK